MSPQTFHNIKASGGGGGGARRKIVTSSPAALLAIVGLLIAVSWTANAAAATATENDQKSNNQNVNLDSSPSYGGSPSSSQNDIYIDDDGLEGSGSRGEVHDDLEKEDDEASGSGFGDDDEDSTARRTSSSSSSSSSSGSNINHILRSDNLPGSGDHEDNDLYTDTNLPPVDPSTTDDEDMPIGKENSKSSSSAAGGGTRYPNAGDTRDPTTDTELDLGGLPRHHATPTEGGSSGGSSNNNHHDNTLYGPGSGVLIMNAKNDDRTASFFAQPGILAAVIGGAVVGLLCAILVVMFIVYRMRKKDEGSYALDEPKRSPTANTYAKNANNREFYA
ncbi:syndecan isoform X1 [Anopheles bellator]|uniref:syndecan isoform X1 n=1 Tax=Anopheles bellator TaxID=139047 RepID=UPI002648CB36|nr:syndecan isoform X1 [Anopheles bellator]